MKEFWPANRSQQNQDAKKLLNRVNVSPDPSQLYVLQLARWAVDEGLLDVHRSDLVENLDQFLAGNQDQVWEFLLASGDLDLGSDAPINAAVNVLGHLDSRLGEQRPGYPRARDLPANYR